MSDTQKGRPLRALALPGLSANRIERLRGQWITTIEELAGATATEAAKASVAKLLDATPKEIEELLERARDILGPDRFRQLTAGEPGGPLGVVLTQEQKKRFGLQ